ncbi:ABC transporter ATP-binding protein [Parafrankia soli]|uniref:ABC transporter ATP-binding protein n=1 Tax=Parafrankia soli TaxID=2599596 RepID=A0A1S1PXW8_9ACTN|nr:ABC transporter ATP-binding protein [Parafrankia soli]OHV25682.1 ABC transporter ATP-binding protein [Parafrankia soli]
MTTSRLRIEALTVGYNHGAVVRGLDITVDPGEVVALLGANGAGKTTTLRTISGLLSARSGSITLDGKDLARLSASGRARAGIAHVPEGRGNFFGLSVAEHLRLRARGERPNVDLVYQYFPRLAGFANRPAGLLSGGEQQMLAIGRALARRPKLLLVDELSLGLAPLVVAELLPVIRQYADESGCGVVLVEQHVQLALATADRAYVLSHGEIVLHDRGERLRHDRDLLMSSYFGEGHRATADGPARPADAS